MVKLLRFKLMLLMAMVLMGAGNVWGAETADVTYDFTESGWTASNGTLSNGTVSFSGAGGANFKMSSGYFMMGKKDAYINFPTYTSAVKKIVVTGNSGASASTGMNIFVGNDAASTETTGSKETNTYEIASGKQAAGTQYTLKVTSAHNAQITKIEVFFVSSSEVSTTLTIDDKGITNTDVYSSTEAGSLSATVKAGDNIVTGATVTWESSNEGVATIDSKGAVTLVAEGTTTITAKYAGVKDQYLASSSTFELTVTNSDPNKPGTKDNPYTVAQALAFTPATGTSANVYIKGIVSKFEKADIMSDGANYRYYISDDGLKTSDQLQVYKGKGLNNVAFSDADDLQIEDEVVVYGGLTTYNTTKEVASGNYIVSLSRKTAPTLTVEDIEMTVEQEKVATALYTTNSDGTITFVSSDETIAAFDASNTLKALKKGTTTITVNVSSTTTYKSASKSFTLEVKENPDKKPEGPSAGGKFVKVTKTADIVDGNYLIVNEDAGVAFDGSLETLDAADNFIDVTIDNGEIAATDAGLAAVFTVNVTDGTLKSASGLYIGVSSNSNGLKQTTESSTYTNSFGINDDGDAVITAVFESSTMTLRYNSASNQNRFRYYKSGQQPIQLYRYVVNEATTFTTTIGEAGVKTFVSASNVSFPTELSAYIVTGGDVTATLSKVTQAKAGEPVLLAGAAGDYTLTIVKEDVAAADGNLLKVSDETTSNGVYVLAKKSGVIGFYQWTGGLLGKGRVYLDLPTSVREFIGINFDEVETTGIKGVKQMKENRAIYNLRGMRVTTPSKGLYIIGGKKVVIK